ncbi:MAG: RNA-dependent RNA polymerase [Hangzhou rhabdovirus 2]|nr:MAG: RNA-dependent RNA polymerase [Hangzhou rhabdovirus 2]
MTLKYLQFMSFLDDQVLSMAKIQSGIQQRDFTLPLGCYWTFSIYGYKFYAIDGGMVIESLQNTPSSSTGLYLCGHQDFLSFCSIISQRGISYLYSDFCQPIVPEECPTPGVVETVLFYFDLLIEKSGNSAFDCIKKLESLCLGFILEKSKHKKLSISREYEMESKKLFMEECIKIDCKELGESILYELDQIESTRHLSQIFGLYRFMGIPFVDGLEGLRKVQEKGTTVFNPRPSHMLELTTFIKKSLCYRYKRKMKVWPNVNLTYLGERSEVRLALENERMPNIKSPLYNESDWYLIQFEESFTKIQGYDVPMYLDDKAISPNLNRLIECIELHRNLGFTEDKKLLIRFLKSNLTSLSQLVDKYDKIETDMDEMLIGLQSKEKELKIIPRKYAKMAEGPRNMQVFREKTSKVLAPLFPEITMSDGYREEELKKQKLSSRQGKHKNYVSICLSMDFSSWANAMRGLALNPLLESLDQLLGYKELFKNIHKNFETSIIYEADGYDDVNLSEARLKLIKIRNGEKIDSYTGEGYFIGMLGGLEGQAQYVWTILTTLVVNKVLDPMGILFSALGQGDNVTIHVDLPVYEVDKYQNPTKSEQRRIEKKIIDIKEKLRFEFQNINQTLKREETWASDCISTYGKDLRENGALLPFSMKRISRASGFCNENFPTLENALSSISSAGEAANYYSVSIQPSLCLTLCMSYYTYFKFTSNHPILPTKVWPHSNITGVLRLRSSTDDPHCYNIYERAEAGKELSESISEVNVHSCGCPSLGFFPVANAAEMLTRGCADQVSRGLFFLKASIVQGNYDTSTMKKLLCWSNIPLSDTIDLEMLLEDPMAVNIANVPSQKNITRQYTKEILEDNDFVLNPGVREFVKLAGESTEDLVQQLLMTEPLFPRALRVIFDATVNRQAIQLLSKFSSTRTLDFLAFQKVGDAITRKLVASEERKLLYNRWRSQQDPITELWDCSTKYADYLRRISWDREDLVGSTSACILEAYTVCYCEGVSLCNLCKPPSTSPIDPFVMDNYVICVVNPKATSREEILFERGPLIAYIGSGTEDKAQRKGMVQLAKGDSRLVKAIKALKLIGVICTFGDNLSNLIIDIFKTVTDADIWYFISDEATMAGSAIHRINDGISDRSCFISTCSTPFMHMSLSTNKMKSLQRDGENYAVSWQESMVILETIASHIINDTTYTFDPIGFHMHPTCKGCFVPLPSDQVSLEQVGNRIHFEPKVSRSWSFFKTEDIEKSIKPVFKGTMDRYDIDNDDFALYSSSFFSGREGCLLSINEDKSQGVLTIEEKGGTPYNYILKSDINYFLHGVGITMLSWGLSRLINSNKSGNITWGEVCNQTMSEIPNLRKRIYRTLNKLVIHPSTRNSLLSRGLLSYLPNSIPYEVQEVEKSCSSILSEWIMFAKEQRKLLFTQLKKVTLLVKEEGHRSFIEASSYISLICLMDLISRENFDSQRSLEWNVCYKLFSEKWKKIGGIIMDNNLGLTKQKKILWDNIFLKSLKKCKIMQSSYDPDKLLKLVKVEVDSSSITMDYPETEIIQEKHELIGGIVVLGDILSSDQTEGILYQEDLLPDRPINERVCLIGDLQKPLLGLTTAHYKWNCIFEYLSIVMNQKLKLCVCLADGTGGISALFLSRDINNRVLFNTLIVLDRAVEDAVGSLLPAAIENIHAKDRIIGVDLLDEMKTDIRSEGFRVSCRSVVGKEEEPYFIICDAEHGNQIDEIKNLKQFVKTIHYLALGSDREIKHVLKFYMSDVTVSKMALSIFSSYFEKVRIIGCAMSPSGSRERFAIVWRPNQMDNEDVLEIKKEKVERLYLNSEEVSSRLIELGWRIGKIGTETLGSKQNIRFTISWLRSTLSKVGFWFGSIEENLWIDLCEFILKVYPNRVKSWFLIDYSRFDITSRKNMSTNEIIVCLSFGMITSWYKKSEEEVSNYVYSNDFPGSVLFYRRNNQRFGMIHLKNKKEKEEIKSELEGKGTYGEEGIIWELPTGFKELSKLRIASRVHSKLCYIDYFLKRQKTKRIRFVKSTSSVINDWIKKNRKEMQEISETDERVDDDEDNDLQSDIFNEEEEDKEVKNVGE